MGRCSVFAMGRFSASAVACLIAAGAAFAGSGGTLGHLTARDQVSIEAAKGSLEINDAGYPYAGGERIVTGESGHAVLTVSGGAIAFDPTSAAAVTAAPGGYQVALEAGSVGVKAGRGPGFTILAGSLRTEAATVDGPLDVRVAFDPDGRILVENRGAAVRVSAGDRFTRVDGGETWSFESVPATDRPTNEAGLPRGRLVERSAAVVGTVGVAIGSKEIRESLNDDDDEDATSPN
jgi:hypothetical protein